MFIARNIQKFTDQQVKYIRLMLTLGVTQKHLAHETKSNEITIQRIAKGYTYRDVVVTEDDIARVKEFVFSMFSEE